MQKFNSPEELARSLWDKNDKTRPEVLQRLASGVPEEFREEFIMGLEQEIDSRLPLGERYNYGKKVELARHLWRLSGQDDVDEDPPIANELPYGPLHSHIPAALHILIYLNYALLILVSVCVALAAIFHNHPILWWAVGVLCVGVNSIQLVILLRFPFFGLFPLFPYLSRRPREVNSKKIRY